MPDSNQTIMKHDNVKIATPFGGMTVKTNDAAVVEELGCRLSGCGADEEG